MCLAIPGKITKIEGGKAHVDYFGEVREAMMGDSDAKIGDYVMVQMGIVVKILTPEEAEISLEAWGSCS
jgi:hydrogenase expression/formation protein HypC